MINNLFYEIILFYIYNFLKEKEFQDSLVLFFSFNMKYSYFLFYIKKNNK